MSVPSNIAEGDSRGFDRDAVRFFLIARGSLAEVCTQTHIAEGVGLLSRATAVAWRDECDHIGRMLNALIQRRRNRAKYP